MTGIQSVFFSYYKCVLHGVVGGYKEEQTGKCLEALHRNYMPISTPIKFEAVFPPLNVAMHMNIRCCKTENSELYPVFISCI
jgi:hypothetical protein